MSAPLTARVVGARRRRLLVVILAVAVVAAAAWVVTRSPVLDVDHVVVRGNTRTPTTEVLEASGVHPGDPMVWLDPDGAVAAVEALPWIGQAEVRREWPDTVRILVRERVPVAWVDAGGGSALVVDRTGRVLTIEAPPPGGLPRVLGVTAPAPVGGRVSPSQGARIAAALAPDALAAVQSIDTSGDRVTVAMHSGVEVRLGRPTRIADKMRAALAVLARPEVEGKVYVDVSVPSNPVAG